MANRLKNITTEDAAALIRELDDLQHRLMVAGNTAGGVLGAKWTDQALNAIRAVARIERRLKDHLDDVGIRWT